MTTVLEIFSNWPSPVQAFAVLFVMFGAATLLLAVINILCGLLKVVIRGYPPYERQEDE